MNYTHSDEAQMKTDRLILRRFVPEDAKSMLDNWIADPRVQREYGEPVYESEDEVIGLINEWIKQYQTGGLHRWAVILGTTHACIGQIAFCRVYAEDKTAEVEYCVGRGYWGRGYAAEALKAVIEYTFENTDFIKLEAFARSENEKSVRVLAKTCMKEVPNVKRFEIDGRLPEGKTCYAATKNGFRPESNACVHNK